MKLQYFAVILSLSLSVFANAQEDPARRNERGSPGWHIPEDAELYPGTVIVKFRRSIENRLSKHAVAAPSLSPLLARYGVRTMVRMYPAHESAWLADGSEIALQRMYRVAYTTGDSPVDVARAFAALPEVEYAEPEVVQRMVYQPDDPRLGEQYALVRVQAEQAWDITTGSGEVVIGIVDSGVMLAHEDLADNIWINPGEDIDADGRFTAADIDSIDNDGNGYVDDIVGIDLVGRSLSPPAAYYDNDPDPTPTGHPHGTHVAGISAATGDNGRGIAGLAYSCRIMAVKCAPDVYTTSIIRGYDGIVYAADNGADVINCSWAGGGYLRSQKERIDYAIARGAVVVAAAGNSGSERVLTPAAYPNVLCVANTTANDRVNGSSTYGPWVDVSAPGTEILSAVISSDSSYQKFTGTSMASPLVAGLAALVKSHRPALLPEQIFEQIRVTSDPIDDLQDERYHQKIGRGRINAFRALTVTSPALRLEEWSFSDSLYGNGDGIADQGERLVVFMKWRNYLEPTANAVVTLSSTNPGVTILQERFEAGTVPNMGEVDNTLMPFVIELDDVYAPNEQVDLVYEIDDGAYRDRGGVFFISQPSYRDHDINDIVVTLSSDGNVGFDDLSGVTGSGFSYRGSENVLYEGALIIGAKVNQVPFVVDVARTRDGEQMRDFEGESLYHIRTPGRVAEQEGYGRFWDALAPLSYRVQTQVTLKSFAFTRPEGRNMVFLRYTIRNVSTNLHEDLHAGLFFDWDIGQNSYTDIAIFHDGLDLALSFDSTGTQRTPVAVGTLLLTPEHGINYWGINNGDRDDSLRIGIHNGFSKQEKWKALSSGIVQSVTAITDVSQLLSAGPIDLAAGDSIVLGFALIAGETPLDVLNAVPDCRALWDTINRLYDPTAIGTPPALPRTLRLLTVAPNPVPPGEGALMLELEVERPGWCETTLYDASGRIAAILDRSYHERGRRQAYHLLPALPAGLYFLEIRSANTSDVAAIVIAR